MAQQVQAKALEPEQAPPTLAEQIAADPEQALIALDIVDAEESLHEFIKQAWHILELDTEFVDNWHIEALCLHLEAVTRGEITRLLINIPPGTMKSLIVSVFWPAWEWGPRGMPHLRFLSSAYSDHLVTRDTRKMRDLVLSEWYQARWGAGAPPPEEGKEDKRVILTRTGETSFENKRRGNREGQAFSSLTGGRGDRVIIDDPHSTEQAESDAERKTALRIFRESLPSRVNDIQRSAIVIIMQRLHEEDVSGEILANELGYEHLCLPMEFDPERKCKTSIGWEDPRTEEDELLFPARFPREKVEELKRTLGSYAYAGQYQQIPGPRGGGIFQVDKIEIVPAAPKGGRSVRGWDLAGSTKKDSAYTTGCRMKRVDGVLYVEHVTRGQWGTGTVYQKMKDATHSDGHGVFQCIPQDPGQAGKAQKLAIAGYLEGYQFGFTLESGTKEDRALPLAPLVEAGAVKLVKGDWNKAFLNELEKFPTSKVKDQVDAFSRAYARILKLPKVVSLTGPKTVPRD